MAVAFKLMTLSTCDALPNAIRGKQWLRFRRLIISMVLATDMKKHMTLIADVKTMIETHNIHRQLHRSSSSSSNADHCPQILINSNKTERHRSKSKTTDCVTTEGERGSINSPIETNSDHIFTPENTGNLPPPIMTSIFSPSSRESTISSCTFSSISDDEHDPKNDSETTSIDDSFNDNSTASGRAHAAAAANLLYRPSTDPTTEPTLRQVMKITTPHQKLTVLQMLLHCADLGNPTKQITTYKSWTQRIMEEYWRQGEIEKSLGLEVQPMFDKEKSNIPQTQVGFIDYMQKNVNHRQPIIFLTLKIRMFFYDLCSVSPLWELWVDLCPDAYFILESLDNNRQYYANLLEESQKNDQNK